MSSIKNLSTNPSREVNVTGMTAAATGGTLTVSRPTTGGHSGTGFARGTYGGSPNAGSGFMLDATITGIDPAKRYGCGLWVRASRSARLSAAIQFLNAADAVVATVTGPQIIVPANVWTRVSVYNAVLTLPGTTTKARPAVFNWTGTGQAAWVAGDTIDSDDVILTEGAAPAFFDGNSPLAVWDGTVGVSSSTLYTPELTLTPNMDAAPRVDVTVEDLPTDIAKVTLYRLADGRQHRVRGAVGKTVAGALAVIDHEVPFGVESTYRAEMFDSGGQSLGYTDSSMITVVCNDCWIHNPLEPGGAVLVDIDYNISIRRPFDGEKLYPQGRRVAVIVSGQRRGITEYPLHVTTDTEAATDAFRALLGDDYTSEKIPVLCVRTPPQLRVPRVFFVDGMDLTEQPINAHIGGNLTEWMATVDETAPPAEALIVPLLTRADLNAYYPSRAALNADNLTRLAVNSRYDLAGTA